MLNVIDFIKIEIIRSLKQCIKKIDPTDQIQVLISKNKII